MAEFCQCRITSGLNPPLSVYSAAQLKPWSVQGVITFHSLNYTHFIGAAAAQTRQPAQHNQGGLWFCKSTNLCLLCGLGKHIKEK